MVRAVERYQDGSIKRVEYYDLTTTPSSDLVKALEKILQWSEAYPLSVFPEPDFKKAAELLKAGGITLDAVSVSCMRYVVEGVGDIARAALTRHRQGEKAKE